MQSILENPVAFATAFLLVVGTPMGWLWKLHNGLRDKVAECEKERALQAREITELRGAVNTLTKLLKREIHLA